MIDYNKNGAPDAEDQFIEYAFYRSTVEQEDDDTFSHDTELGCVPGLLAFLLFLLVLALKLVL